MASPLEETRSYRHPTEISRAGLAATAIISLLMVSALLICLKRRIQATRYWTWSKVPPTTWVTLIIYTDSIVFIVATSVLVFGLGVNLNVRTCSSAILLALLCYMSTKFMYYYFVEKIYIASILQGSRLKSKLYCCNLFVILVLYCLTIVLNVIYRTSHLTSNGMCIVGVRLEPLVIFIVFDAALNLYLTLLFIIPLQSICTKSQARYPLLRTMCFRSLVSCVLTIITTTANLTALLGLHQEPAWVFLLCCNVDLVFLVLIRRWVTLKSLSSTSTSLFPEDIMVNESNAAAPSFFSSERAQNIRPETEHCELVIDHNGKVTEVTKVKTTAATKEKHNENRFKLASAKYFPENTTPPNSLNTDGACLSGSDWCDDKGEDDDEEHDGSETESLGRAIITTHISAQDMQDLNDNDSFRNPLRACHHDLYTGIKAELGGIRVMIEQVVEVEYKSDNGTCLGDLGL